MVVRKAQGRIAHTMSMNTHGCWVCIILNISFLPIQIKNLQRINYWWLVESPWGLLLPFCSKFWHGGRDL